MEYIEVAFKQFMDNMFRDWINAMNNLSNKCARVVNHVAKEIVALHCYLGANAYHFKNWLRGMRRSPE